MRRWFGHRVIVLDAQLPMVAEYVKTVEELGEWMRAHSLEEYPISEALANTLRISARPTFREYGPATD